MRAIHLACVGLGVLVATASASADPVVTGTPFPCRGSQTIVSTIDQSGDVDSYSIFLGAGDALSVAEKSVGPLIGLNSTVTIADPTGADVTASAITKGEGSRKTSLSYVAVTAGLHVLTIAGDGTGLAGSKGDYQMALTVKRAKVPSAAFSDAAGGLISVTFTAPALSTVSVTASTKKGGFDLVQLLRPDGTPEPGFSAALKAKKRRSATAKVTLTGGDGTYELRGNFDAGSKVTVKTSVATNEKKVKRPLAPEPVLDPTLPPFPSQGVPGTVFSVAGANLDDIPVLDGAGHLIGHTYPSFWIGGVAVPPASVSHPNGSIYQFPVPLGLAENQSHSFTVRDADGQGFTMTDAFFVVPAPVAESFSIATAGPLGGRVVRISGQYFRANVTVIFDTTVVQPTTVKSEAGYLDVVAPAHAPGDVVVKLRDEFGRSSSVPSPFTYLNIGSNRITSTSPSYLQGLGFETITVDGVDFGADTVMTLDGAAVAATLVSSSVMRFTSPVHASATVKLRVTDQYQQTFAADVQVKGLTDDASSAIPAPVTTSNGVDGWRAGRVLVGDVNGDGYPDLVLLRPEAAFGNDVNRSRLRLLLNDGSGVFSDATGSKMPAIVGDEDWRAKDGVLIDLNGDGSKDLAIITDAVISGGTRPSLRALSNSGNGTFTDATSTSVPAATSYGDHWQGVAIAAANLDATSGNELVIVDANPIVDASTSPSTYYPGTRVLLNDGNGVFSLAASAVPAVSESSPTQYQGVSVVVGPITGSGHQDIVVVRDQPPPDPANSGAYVRAASLLSNNGSAAFTDVSSTKLPAPNGAEYMQGNRLYLADLDGDGAQDLVVASIIGVVDPVTSQLAATPGIRFFRNNGSGTFTQLTNVLPAADAQDQLQADAVAVGDLNGDGAPEVFVTSTRAPNTGERAGRVVVKVGNAWVQGSPALPDPAQVDDLRGDDAVMADVDGDGDLDLVVVRDEANDSVRNTIVLKNPRR